MVSLPLPSVCVFPSSVYLSASQLGLEFFLSLFFSMSLLVWCLSQLRSSFSSCDSLLGLDSLPPHPLICVISPHFYISVPLIYSESDENFKVLICQMMCHDIFWVIFLVAILGIIIYVIFQIYTQFQEDMFILFWLFSWVISIMLIVSTSITILAVHYWFLQHNLCLLK